MFLHNLYSFCYFQKLSAKELIKLNFHKNSKGIVIMDQVNKQIHMCVCVCFVFKCLFIYVCVCIYIYWCAYIFAHICTYIYTYIVITDIYLL